WVLARVLEEPYLAARQSVNAMTRVQRRVAHAAMLLFLLAVLVGNVFTIQLLAKAREESVKLRQVLENTDSETGDVVVDQAAINRAITAVSLAVVVDGSILFLVMIADLKNLDRRIRANIRFVLGKRRLPPRERAYLEAQAKEASCHETWNNREARVEA